MKINIYKTVKSALVIVFLPILSIESIGQKLGDEIICSPDTMFIKNIVIKTVGDTIIESTRILKAQSCVERRRTGARFEFGISSFHYGEKTSSWLGQHGGPNFNLVFLIEKVNLGLRFKPWTISPVKELEFNGVILPQYASLNPIKVDFYAGYTIDLTWNMTLLPFLGFNRSSFYVINEDELQQTYSFSKATGFITGLTIDKYFEINDFEFISIFGTVGYGFVDYAKVHPELDKGYFEWTIGVAFKGYFKRSFTNFLE